MEEEEEEKDAGEDMVLPVVQWHLEEDSEQQCPADGAFALEMEPLQGEFRYGQPQLDGQPS